MDQKIKTILKGCLLQDRSSQKKLHERFYSYSMSISVRYLQDYQLAELAVNDSFMKVFNNIEKFDFEKPFKPWFRRILVNTSLDHLKKNKKHTDNINTNISEAENISDQEHILSNISYQELLDLVHKLSDAYRNVFNMYVIDGFKHEEISHKLNISVGTSKSNLSKARTNLKALIAEQLIIQENG